MKQSNAFKDLNRKKISSISQLLTKSNGRPGESILTKTLPPANISKNSDSNPGAPYLSDNHVKKTSNFLRQSELLCNFIQTLPKNDVPEFIISPFVFQDPFRTIWKFPLNFLDSFLIPQQSFLKVLCFKNLAFTILSLLSLKIT